MSCRLRRGISRLRGENDCTAVDVHCNNKEPQTTSVTIVLTRRAGFEEVDHAPDAVDLAAFDDLEGLRAAEGFVRGLQPTGKLFGGRERLAQLGIQSADFDDRA